MFRRRRIHKVLKSPRLFFEQYPKVGTPVQHIYFWQKLQFRAANFVTGN